MNNGYDVYFDTPYGLLTFPITPSEIKIKSGSNNETVTLIDEGEINILKSPSLTEVEFEARFPMRKYPFSRNPERFETYFAIFEKLKEKKKPFRFIVARTTPNGTKTWDTNMLVALEDLETDESADEGDDVIVAFALKRYKNYGVTVLKNTNKSTSSSNTNRNTTSKGVRYYTVKNGDCLWLIAKRFYGNGADWKKIYNANKSAIEKDAKAHGYKSSSNGHWIWAGLKLTIPE